LSGCQPGAVKKFKTGRDREGEAPAEPHGAGFAGAMARQEARPPNFFTALLSRGRKRCTLGAGDIPIYGAAERGNGWLS